MRVSKAAKVAPLSEPPSGKPTTPTSVGGQAPPVAGRDDVDVLAHDVAALAGRVGVEHHLAGLLRLAAGDDVHALEVVAGGRVGPVAADGWAGRCRRSACRPCRRRRRRTRSRCRPPGRPPRRPRARPRAWHRPCGSWARTSASVLSGRTTTSPTVEAIRAVKLRLRVSLKTRVPTTNETPMTMANVLISRRTLRPSRLLRAARNISPPPAARFRAILDDAVPVGVAQLVDDPAVGQEHHAIGVRRRHRVVGHHHDGLAVVGGAAAEQVEHLGARLGVEVAGRLVGEHDAWAARRAPAPPRPAAAVRPRAGWAGGPGDHGSRRSR